MTGKTIIVLYYTRGVYPLRNTIETHLYCWRKYSKHHVVYVNVALGFPDRLIDTLDIDAIIFHTIFLGMRWSPDIFRTYTEKCSALKGLDCMKIAIPQDEFMNTELLNDFINDFGVTDLLTCADESDWPIIYNKINREKVHIQTVLTGYLDTTTVRRINRMKKKMRGHREIDIGYRAWKAEYWLGELGQHKARIADVFISACQTRNLNSDISTRSEDVLNGDSWFKFLLRCKSTIGVQGGSSILDNRGDIKRRVDTYLEQHPDAGFEEVRANCFPHEDNKLGLACISPRHLEACATETLQLLVEGSYNGILQARRHYVPINRDYSNLGDVLDVLQDDVKVKEITSNAYREIVLSNKWTYGVFVRDIERSIIDAKKSKSIRRGLRQWLVKNYLNLLDLAHWQFIHFEVWFLASRNDSRLVRTAYRCLSKLFPAF